MKEIEEQDIRRFVDLWKQDMEHFRADQEQMERFWQDLDSHLQQWETQTEEEPSSNTGRKEYEQEPKKKG